MRGKPWSELGSGLVYAFRDRPIRALLLTLAITGLAGMPYTTLMPVVARTVLHGDASTLGALMAGSGTGALLGALYLASRPSVLGLGRLIAGGSALFGAALIALSFSRSLLVSLPLMVVSGLFVMVQMASTNTILQTVVDEDKRGRVMSLYSMAIFGTTPFGSLLAGTLADRVGAPLTLLGCGALCVVSGVWFTRRLPVLRGILRPVYRRLGILPELAEGVSEATMTTRPPA